MLPKQWRHWCADQNLRLHGKKWGQRKSQWFYLKGRGHVWRVSDRGMLQRGSSHAEFDRWALCDVREVPMPKTLAKFRQAVDMLLTPTEPPKEQQNG